MELIVCASGGLAHRRYVSLPVLSLGFITPDEVSCHLMRREPGGEEQRHPANSRERAPS